ncbi:MAG: alpha/beta hydrolase [Chloroflexi bacterium]|nr:alpha/beta hydrolase [Chloroflexota bacterium]
MDSTLRRPTEKWLTTNGLRMRYLEWYADGSPVVALHGLASSADWYRLTLPRLSPPYQCIALDQRAHGKTDQPSRGYDWDTLTADVLGALDQLGLERVALLGHSWGANVALKTAARHPARIRRLVLIDGGFFDPRRRSGMTWETFRQRLRPRDIYGPPERYLGALRQELADCWSEELESILMAMVRIDPDGSVHERLEPENHAQVLRAMWDEPPSVSFPLVQCPTLIVAAMPQETPENAEFAALRRDSVQAAKDALPDCRVAWIAKSGHDIGFFQPALLAQAVQDFLEE